MSDPVADFMGGGDPEVASLIRERAKRMVNMIFDQAENDLQHGDAGSKAAAYKHVLPLLTKVAQSASESDTETARLLEQGSKILADMQATLPTYDAFETDDATDVFNLPTAET